MNKLGYIQWSKVVISTYNKQLELREEFNLGFGLCTQVLYTQVPSKLKAKTGLAKITHLSVLKTNKTLHLYLIQ